MSKRDRAARAKDAAGDTAASAADELEVSDATDDSDGESTTSLTKSADTELRPSGKRSGRGRRSASATGTSDGDSDSAGGTAVAVKERKKKKASPAESRNPLVRIWLFLQQVVTELRKVIWPSRRDLVVYTAVVLVFVIIMTAFIFGIDLGFAKGVLWLFG
ncbi:preprotein translocase subunit SecE [Gordonia polyisoprenivorans]|uniref:preprotein translocase subunit SecE n=1 Tax=Gordonia polyisoprenivorans TaxID=84595 RepID=UPI001AD78799|nr:preprotein translocase subunit SecE [Gordonia polyisoprenivorans]QTI70619.1 preprotein translocase subunit SecE [Gordonia polyisoprenivorans]